MNLGDVRIGQTVTIETVGGQRGFRRRLMELGLVPGTAVELLAVAPLGDPLKLRVRGCTLSIRRAEATFIDVNASSNVNGVETRPQINTSPGSTRLEVGLSV
ncbi:MAG: FeoA family protein [Polyangiaceae bacterium]|nr:FeoA family protein [Polyangiaceae bacterium]